MADLRRLNRRFSVGDPHTPNDMNRIALSSGTLQATIEREHRPDGTHKPPFVPFATARVLWDGTTYGLGDAYGVAGVTTRSLTEVEVHLSPAARTSDWGPIVWPDNGEATDPRAPSEIHGTRTISSVVIRLTEPSSFTFQAFDRR